MARQGSSLASLGIIVEVTFDRLFGFNNEGQLAFLVSTQNVPERLYFGIPRQRFWVMSILTEWSTCWMQPLY